MKQQDVQGGGDRFRIAIMGAGPGGICTAIKLKQAGFEDFVILERSACAGGTWNNNRYPGLACDAPSLLYSFSFEQKVDWTRTYADQPEILEYMLGIVDKYGLAPYIRCNAGVRQARWDDAVGQWQLATDDGRTVTADVFISALGMFNEIQYPDIAGLAGFGGTVLHTAKWPAGTDLRGKSVAVIGSAASAVQMIPEVAKQARQLTVYQRTANWVMPKEDKVLSPAELAEFRARPDTALKMRQDYFDFFEALLTYDKPDLIADFERQGMENLQAVKDPETRRKLTPTVPWGAQRPLFSNEYYPTFNLPHVTLVTDPIERITAHGVCTADRVERAADVLVLATGYAANKYLSVIEVAGRNGLRLKDAWRAGPQAYLGITTAGFPNLFMLYGPNTNNGSILCMLEYQVDYVVRKLVQMRDQAIAWIDVRKQAMDDYNEALQREIEAVQPWRSPGSKYYRVPGGRIVTQWPHTMVAYQARTQVPDWAAFESHRRERVAA